MDEASARATWVPAQLLDDLRVRLAGLLVLPALLPLLGLVLLMRGTAPGQGGVLFAFVIVLALVAIVTAIVGARQLTAPLAHLARDIRSIATGEREGQLPLTGPTQIVAVRRAVNDLIGATATEAQRQGAQGDVLQTQIVRLLEEISAVAEGDLTVEAEVSADALGAVADSFNYMIAELRRIVGRVNAATQQVSHSTDEILTTTDTLSRSAEQQAARIADTSAAIEEMAVSIQQVAENAALSAQVAREARDAASAGAASVTATVEGMGRIRGQVRETARKIERLGASSQEIGAIVSLIKDVADQTGVLALNAAIRAAAAGEHGRGFAVVAEEVRHLAERVTVASAQIDTLVKGIQADTGEAAIAMTEGSQEVASGVRVADEAGRALARIDATARQLADLIEAISLAADQQARASAGIARAMGEIAGLTTGTIAGTRQAAAAVAALATLADDLRQGVAAFRLDAATVRAAGLTSAPLASRGERRVLVGAGMAD